MGPEYQQVGPTVYKENMVSFCGFHCLWAGFGLAVDVLLGPAHEAGRTGGLTRFKRSAPTFHALQK
jgi:hypothetical protein